MAKRSLTDLIGGPSTPATSLSENVNLFQSLRVLQEGEVDTEFFQNTTSNVRSGTSILWVGIYFFSYYGLEIFSKHLY